MIKTVYIFLAIKTTEKVRKKQRIADLGDLIVCGYKSHVYEFRDSIMWTRRLALPSEVLQSRTFPGALNEHTDQIQLQISGNGCIKILLVKKL